MNQYHEHGCEDRAAYLRMLSELHDIPMQLLQTLADRLGSAGDFTLLLDAISDYERHVSEIESEIGE